MKIFLTKNLDKPGDFVNGMEATVEKYEERSKCLRVRTRTGQRHGVHLYTDPEKEHKGVTYFPIRLGYASTIHKVQGTTLEHVTIYLDREGAPATGYVALSRVRTMQDYSIGGKVTRAHFVPATMKRTISAPTAPQHQSSTSSEDS